VSRTRMSRPQVRRYPSFQPLRLLSSSPEPMTDRPSVLFVCLKNNGKSQLAARLFRAITGDAFDVGSAGTRAGDHINGLFAATLQELGVDVTGQKPRQLTYRMNREADRVVVLGRTVDVQPIAGTTIEVWDIDEPSRRGIGGVERMRLIRDDIAVHVEDLAKRLSDIGNSEHH